jgi:hypothetical protein
MKNKMSGKAETRNHLISHNANGQTLVEFAIVIPILLLLVFGLIEFGRLMFSYAAVTTASREATRYGTASGTNDSGTPFYLDCQGIKDAAKRIGSLVGVADDDITIYYDEGPDSIGPFPNCPVDASEISLDNRIVVEITGNYNPMPVLPFVNLSPIEFSSVSRRTILKNIVVLQAGPASGGGTPTSTFTATSTSTETSTSTTTGTATETSTASSTATSTATLIGTRTSTPTVAPISNPIYFDVTYTQNQNKCEDIHLYWLPNTDWATYPGGDPLHYQTYTNGSPSGTVPPDYINSIVWNTGVSLNNNITVVFTVQAIFPGPTGSEVMTKGFECDQGSLVDLVLP